MNSKAMQAAHKASVYEGVGPSPVNIVIRGGGGIDLKRFALIYVGETVSLLNILQL